MIEKETAIVLGFGSALDCDQGFFEMGLDSLMAVELRSRLEKALGISLPVTMLFDQPTIHTLADTLLERNLFSGIPPNSVHAEVEEASITLQREERNEEPIAIIG